MTTIIATDLSALRREAAQFGYVLIPAVLTARQISGFERARGSSGLVLSAKHHPVLSFLSALVDPKTDTPWWTRDAEHDLRDRALSAGYRLIPAQLSDDQIEDALLASRHMSTSHPAAVRRARAGLTALVAGLDASPMLSPIFSFAVIIMSVLIFIRGGTIMLLGGVVFQGYWIAFEYHAMMVALMFVALAMFGYASARLRTGRWRRLRTAAKSLCIAAFLSPLMFFCLQGAVSIAQQAHMTEQLEIIRELRDEMRKIREKRPEVVDT